MGLNGPGAKPEPFPEFACILIAHLIMNPNLFDALLRKPYQHHAAEAGADALLPPAGGHVGVVDEAVPVRQDNGRALRNTARDESDNLLSVAGYVRHGVPGCEEVCEVDPQVVFRAGRSPPDRIDRLYISIEFPGQSRQFRDVSPVPGSTRYALSEVASFSSHRPHHIRTAPWGQVASSGGGQAPISLMRRPRSEEIGGCPRPFGDLPVAEGVWYFPSSPHTTGMQGIRFPEGGAR